MSGVAALESLPEQPSQRRARLWPTRVIDFDDFHEEPSLNIDPIYIKECGHWANGLKQC